MSSLEETLIARFGNAPKHIPNGRIVRFAGSDKLKSKSCWVRNMGELAFYGNFRDGEKTKCWRSRDHLKLISSMDNFNREKYDKEMKIKMAEEDKVISDAKFEFISEEWVKFDRTPVNNNYFYKKYVNVRKDMRMQGSTVMIPMYCEMESQKVAGIQRIFDEPKNKNYKMFIGGSQPSGAFYPITNGSKLKDCDVIYLCEGYSTGYSLNHIAGCYSEMQSYAVVICFTAFNIKKVVLMLRKYFPEKSLIIAADNDQTGYSSAGDAVAAGANGYIILGDDDEDANDAWVRHAGETMLRFKEEMRRITYA